jgi:hypothetical protein
VVGRVFLFLIDVGDASTQEADALSAVNPDGGTDASPSSGIASPDGKPKRKTSRSHGSRSGSSSSPPRRSGLQITDTWSN